MHSEPLLEDPTLPLSGFWLLPAILRVPWLVDVPPLQSLPPWLPGILSGLLLLLTKHQSLD